MESNRDGSNLPVIISVALHPMADIERVYEGRPALEAQLKSHKQSNASIKLRCGVSIACFAKSKEPVLP